MVIQGDGRDKHHHRFFYPGAGSGTDGCVEAPSNDKEGADIIDIGAESTRPGSSPLSQEEEARRLVPAIEAVRRSCPILISADTFRSETARAALESGADNINDLPGGAFDGGMFPLLAKRGNPMIIMHARDVPGGMHHPVVYGDIIGEIISFFSWRLDEAEKAGLSRDQVILDPGMGFSKNAAQNLQILKGVVSFTTLGRPLLVGHSRKSTIGKVLGLEDPADRIAGTLALSAYCAMKEVPLVRVHDVGENKRAVRIIEALREEGF